ncbi:MAG: hypothetical protein WB755_15760 [Terriglobales bacterium]|jgi:hypothetical protein
MNSRIRGQYRAIGVAFGLASIIGLGLPQSAFTGGADPSLTITVQVDNYSQASPAVLAAAEREAGRILGEAGLRTVWLECPMRASTPDPEGPCQRAPEATDIRLRILAAPIQKVFQDSVFGFAVHPVLASVYYDYAVRRAKSDDAEFEVPIILGCVIAHELGHLLLGSNGHSVTGIMQPRWEAKQVRQLMTGTLLFTTAQSNLMREQVQTLSRLQAGNPDPGLTQGSDK